ncbi:MAG: hypothetical protein E7411_06070 [Ruminococcaceae bacterium]|nr:hypothetical protein [Oscillospiraceae bacterium]
MNYKYYPMHMHLHAACDYGSSMALDMYNASLLGMKYIWFTDHDTRMVRRENEVKGFSFDTSDLMKEDGKRFEGFKVIDEKTDYIINPEEKTLTLNCEGEGDNWETSGVFFASSGTRHTCSLATELTLSVDIKDYVIDSDTRIIFGVKLSQRPPEMANAYMLYVVGEAEDLSGLPHTQIIPSEIKKGQFVMKVSEDVSDEPSIGGKDNAFDTLYIILQSRNGKKASLKVGDFSISRVYYGEELRKRLNTASQKAGEYYGVTPFVSFEISGAGEHKNCFSTKVPVIDYYEYDYNVSEKEAIDHTLKYDGIFALNHPFETKPFKGKGNLPEEEKIKMFQDLYEEFYKNDTYGASLIEVGYPEGRNFPFEYYTFLWDALSLSGHFLAGYGCNDCHRNNKGWFDGNNFAAYIGVDSSLEHPVSVDEFISAMKERRMYTADPVKIKGEIKFETASGEQMGSILNKKEEIINFYAENTLPGWEFRLINNGVEAYREKIKGNTYSHTSCLKSSDKPVDFQRAELYDEDGRCILLTNPIYLTAK